jgi:O-antigen/teichoic acid export membrane protein
MLVWIDQMDIGLGNGLRNQIATYMAHQELQKARIIVSSTMVMLLFIAIPILLILLAVVWSMDVYLFLNVSYEAIPELRIALLSAVTLVCMTFVLKSIGNIYMGLQLPAISNLLIAIGQTIALIGTWILFSLDNATFFNVVIVNTAAPLLTYLLAYPITFYKFFPWLRPSMKLVNLQSALELGDLSIKFFWIQIAAIVQFMTANILISIFFTPEMVTPYQIAYRYLSLVMVAFTVICMPFWNATTDAFERGDIDWIQRSDQRMNYIILIIAATLIFMIAISPWVYEKWIGDSCDVPFMMTCMMAIYIFLLILSMRYSYFLNGIGALRLQLYMTIMTVVFIPASWAVSYYTHDIIWFMAVMSLCVTPSIVVNMIQFHKILKGTAKGLWRK